MRIRNENGSVRWGAVLAVCVVLMAAGQLFAVDSYETPRNGIPGLLVSTNTGAISVPLLQIRSTSTDITNGSGGEIQRTTDRLALRVDATGTGQVVGFTHSVTTNVTLSDQISNPTSNTTFTLSTSLPANSLTAGRKLRLRASGKYTSGTTAYPNLVFTGSLHGVALATTGNVSTSSGTDNAWDVTMDLVVYTSGASGTIYTKITGTNSLISGSGGVTTPFADAVKVGRDTDSIDTTQARTLALLVKVSTSDAAAVVKCEEFSVESLN